MKWPPIVTAAYSEESEKSVFCNSIVKVQKGAESADRGGMEPKTASHVGPPSSSDLHVSAVWYRKRYDPGEQGEQPEPASPT